MESLVIIDVLDEIGKLGYHVLIGPGEQRA